MSEEEIKELSDKELDKAIAEKYGEMWLPEDVDGNDPLIKEWVRRLTSCY